MRIALLVLLLTGCSGVHVNGNCTAVVTVTSEGQQTAMTCKDSGVGWMRV